MTVITGDVEPATAEQADSFTEEHHAARHGSSAAAGSWQCNTTSSCSNSCFRAVCLPELSPDPWAVGLVVQWLPDVLCLQQQQQALSPETDVDTKGLLRFVGWHVAALGDVDMLRQALPVILLPELWQLGVTCCSRAAGLSADSSGAWSGSIDAIKHSARSSPASCTAMKQPASVVSPVLFISELLQLASMVEDVISGHDA